GVGMCPPSRYTASMARVKPTRLRRSGIRKTLVKASRNFIADCLFRGDHGDGAARLADLLLGRFRKQVRGDLDGPRQLSPAQNLQTVFQLVDDAQLQQTAGIERVAIELLEAPHIN